MREPTSVPLRDAVAAPLAAPQPNDSFNEYPCDRAQTNPPTIESPAPIGFFSLIFGLCTNHVHSSVCRSAPFLPNEITTFCAPILRSSAEAIEICADVSIGRLVNF